MVRESVQRVLWWREDVGVVKWWLIHVVALVSFPVASAVVL